MKYKPSSAISLAASLAACCGLVVPSHADPLVVIQPAGAMIMDTTLLADYVTQFSEEDRWFFGVATDVEVSAVNNGVYGGQFVKNADAYDYLKDNIPLFDCPDPEFLKTYYFRWWTFRKHIKNLGTPENRDLIVTEYIDPVNWADSTNAINAPLGHQIYEARWLQDQEVASDYQRYWLSNSAARPRKYSTWLADAVLASQCVNPDLPLLTELLTSTSNLENLQTNYTDWINGVSTPGGASRQSDGLFTQSDGYDAMEVSFGGSGKRPSINTYMFADAKAIAGMFRIAAASDPANTAAYNVKAAEYEQQAETLRAEVLTHLWDPTDEFFKTGYNDFDNGGSLQDRREQIGFTPWAFGLPEDGGAVDYDEAWSHLGSFITPNGLTTGALDETGYNTGQVGTCCRWDGPIWPYATTIALRAMATTLQDYDQAYLSKADYFHELKTYAYSHRQQITQDGETRTIAWIDESMISGQSEAGEWTMIGVTQDGISGNDNPRGFAYNHSGFIDLVISGLAGLRPTTGDVVRVAPLLPDTSWDWFLLDKVAYHGRYLTILWDRDGTKYGRGAGLKVYADGSLIASAPGLEEVFGTLAASPDVLISTSNPPNGATGLLASTSLTVNFNRLIQAGSGNIDLMKTVGAGSELVKSFNVATSSRLTFDGASVTINPTAALEGGAEYFVLIDATAIQAQSGGSSFAGITNSNTWSFAVDGTPPATIALFPVPGSPSIPLNPDLALTFDEEILKGTGTLVVKDAGGTAVQSINVNDDAVLVDGSQVTVDLVDLAPATYYVEVDAGAFVDLSGNPFTGISGSSAWSFTTSSIARFIIVTVLDEETDIVNTGGALVSAANFGGGEALVVNGIAHGAGSAAGTNLTDNFSFEGDYRGGGSGLPNGTILQKLFKGIAGRNAITMSIGGLTPGQNYLFQGYWEANGTGHSLTMTIEGDTVTGVNTKSPGALISYEFQATDNTLNISVDRDDGATSGDLNNWLSGYSLQEVDNFSSWISGFPQVGDLDGFSDDSDNDGLPNGVEAFFGTRPDVANGGIAQVNRLGNTVTFIHPNPAAENIVDDVSGSYKWSPDLVNWYASGATNEGTRVDISGSSNDPATATTTVTATITGSSPTKLFLRAEASL